MGEEVRVTTDKSGSTSAGILLWRNHEGRLEVLLAHQGGPFWVKKDIGHWTIPKGEVEPGEEFVAVARREFAEETGHEAPNHPLIDLGQITQKSGKLCPDCVGEGGMREDGQDGAHERRHRALAQTGGPFGAAPRPSGRTSLGQEWIVDIGRSPRANERTPFR